jgi:hypothetical protein
MNPFRFKTFPIVISRLAVILTAFILLQARGAEPAIPGRWLLVIDTSSTMKKLQPATEAALQRFFSTGADGQLQAGDSVAVWLVNQKIDGQFPTFSAGPTNTGVMASNLAWFLHRQRYAGASQLAVLQSPLNRVVAGSRRLTVLIFTDGQSDVVGTPYDDGINQTFREVQVDRRKTLQPLVVAIRSDSGKYIGCSFGFPPADINFPPFPALPTPPPPVVITPVKVPQPVLPPPAPSLEIVGNKVITSSSRGSDTHSTVAAPSLATNPPPVVATMTNLPPPAPLPAPVAPAAKMEATPAPAPTSEPKKGVAVSAAAVPVPPLAPTNPSPAVAVAPSVLPAAAPSNPPAAAVAKSSPTIAVTNGVVAALEPPGGLTRVYRYAGLGALATSIAFAAIWLVRSRRPEPSLISRSMQDAPPRK